MPLFSHVLWQRSEEAGGCAYLGTYLYASNCLQYALFLTLISCPHFHGMLIASSSSQLRVAHHIFSLSTYDATYFICTPFQHQNPRSHFNWLQCSSDTLMFPVMMGFRAERICNHPLVT